MKKVLIFWLAHRNWDSRVFYKQAISLSKKFYVKCLWGVFSSKKWNWKEEGIKNFWFEWNRIIVLFKWVLYWIRNRADLYVAHDIDSYLVVVLIKLLKWKSKIIFDSHEYYDLYNLSKFNLAWKITLFSFINIIKPFTIKLFSWITVVTEDMTDFYKLNNVETIFNYPEVNLLEKVKSNNVLSNKNKYLVYHWWISEDRGIYEMIGVFEEYLKLDDSVRFLLIGKFSTKELEDKVLDLIKWNHLSDKIIITWQLTLIETISYLKNDVDKIWFCLFDNVWQISKSIPIKMLEYLYLEIPQIWSNHIWYFNKIIEAWRAWVWVKYWEVSNEVSAVQEIFDKYWVYVKNCKDIKNNYTWWNEEKKLLEFYNNI